ncbi:MAG: 6-carboxytetrahydropterin synthase [Planctomycetaceae bacterium]|nr:6-carboxytetrahydropterin synthase [Planctomycetaceae bacterium]
MAIYEISVDHAFTASHAVLMPNGQMEKPHRHDWMVMVSFRAGQVDARSGMVADFLVVKSALDQVCGLMDAMDLNSLGLLGGDIPTAERVARFIAEEILRRHGLEHSLYCVQVTEAVGCRAAFYPWLDEPPCRS